MCAVLQTCAFALVLLVVRGSAHAQTMFTNGQSIQAVYEGWQPNPDGTFSFFFGYLNRNYEEQPSVPVGPDNTFEPGPADRGQPTHFYPRRQQFVFSVKVPADWGKKELVWKITYGGRTTTAIATLAPVWALDEGVWKANRGSGLNGRVSKDAPINKPPSINIVDGETVTVTLPQTLTLTALASDDRLPGPRRPRRQQANQREPSKETEPPVAITGLPSRDRIAGPTTQDMVPAKAAYETGLAVTWLHYRGPGRVTFDPITTSIKPEGEELKGKATTTVSFTEPGTYIIRAVGDDGNLTMGTNLTVIVKPADSGISR